MSSPWTDLLLLHGYIHDPELVRRLAGTPVMALPGQTRGAGMTSVNSQAAGSGKVSKTQRSIRPVRAPCGRHG